MASAFPASIDLTLPEMFTGVGPGSKVDKSHTPVPLLPAYYENVVFEPWDLKDLDSLLDSSFRSISKLDGNVLSSVQQRLNMARESVEMVVPKAPPGAIQELLDSSSITGVGIAELGNNEGKQDGTVMFRTSTDTYIVLMSVIDALQAALNGIYPRNGILKKQREYEVFKIAAMEYKLDKGDVLGVFNAPGSRTNPDMALQRMYGNLMVGPPLCSFEFKGPRMDLGEYARKMQTEKLGKKPNRSNAGTSEEDLPPTSEYYEMSAESMCEYLNEMFGSMSNYNVRTSESRYTTMNRMKPIAQALTQALVTSSGISTLLTYQQGIAFDMDRFDSEGRIVIRVTPLMRCNRQKGVFALSCTTSKLAYDKEQRGFAKTVVKFKEKILKEFEKRQGRDLGKRKNREDRNSEGTGDNSGNGNGRDGRGGRSDQRDRNGEDGADGGNSSEPKNQRTRLGDNQADLSNSGGTDASMEGYENISTVRDVLRRIAVQPHVITADGNSGILLEGFVGDTRVVIKLWNGQGEEGLDEICREVESHRQIQKLFPTLVDSVVPRMHAANTEKDIDALYGGDVFLVTSYVGMAIKFGSDGKLRVADGRYWRAVEDCQLKNIADAAISSLNSLHKIGILHGDIALRNLRVDYVNRKFWRAWWIDVGRMEFGYELGSAVLIEEMDVCKGLFDISSSEDSV